MTMQHTAQDAGQAPLLGDHLAMDALNTQAGIGANAVDFWRTGADVAAWFARNGITPAPDASLKDEAALLLAAQALRTIARELIEQRVAQRMAQLNAERNEEGSAEGSAEGNQAGSAGAADRPGDPARLNPYLHAHLSAPHVETDAEGRVRLARRPLGDAATQMLGTLAESVAQLLADGDFSLVKQCEHPDCVLWFYDRTKAHRRRWCSMGLCGNRVKAAQFRKRANGAP